MKITAIRGFSDILPGEVETWQLVEAKARQIFNAYNFSEIRIPILEKTELFSRSIGETTDIVEKEMYTFEDRDSRSAEATEATKLTLRPGGNRGRGARLCRGRDVQDRAGAQALLHGTDVPPRAAAKGPHAPVSPDRRRGARARRSVSSTLKFCCCSTIFSARWG